MNSQHSSFHSTTQNTDFTSGTKFIKAFIQQRNMETEKPSQEGNISSIPTSIPKHGSSSRLRARGTIFNRQGHPFSSDPETGIIATPLPYPTNLTPNESPLRPHCLAKDRLKLWHPLNTRSAVDAQGRPVPLSLQDLEQIGGVTLNSLQPATQASYSSGLLTFHVFCDQKKIPEDLR